MKSKLLLKLFSKKFKVGYFLFAGFTPEYDRCYVSYGRTGPEIWKKAGARAANINIIELAKMDLDTFKGTLSVETNNGKEKVIVHTDKIGL